MREYLLLFFIIIASLSSSAQNYLLTGRVTDKYNKPVPFAAVYIKKSVYGTVTNDDGQYRFKLASGKYSVVYRCAGYKDATEEIVIDGQDISHNVQLTDEDLITKGVREDSAAGIMEKVIAKRRYYLTLADKYSCLIYVKGVQKLGQSPEFRLEPRVADALSVDSTGKGILYQSESLSDYYFKQPDREKEDVVATRDAGHSAFFNYKRPSDIAVNFYKNTLTIPGISSHVFISPLASGAPHFYKYHLVGSEVVNGGVIHKIQVVPRHIYDPAFSGYIYIVDGDWRLYSADLMLTKKGNGINQIDTLKISQQYIPVANGVWLPLTSRYSFTGTLMRFKFEGYYLSVYNHYNLRPDFSDHYFNGERLRTDTSGKNLDSAYWNAVRLVPLTTQERTDYAKKEFQAEMDRAISKYDPEKVHRNKFLPLPYLIYGYKASYNDDKDSILVEPFITTFFYNTVEGAGIHLGATYAHYYKDLRSFSITPNLQYGNSDKLFTANLKAAYVYDPLHKGALTIGFGNEVLDLNNEGTRSLYFNTLSTLLSEQNYVKYYRSDFGQIGYQHEISNGILLNAAISYANRTQLYNNSYYTISTYAGRRLTSNNPLTPDAPATDRSVLFPKNQAFTFNSSLTFTLDQQYDTGITGRVYEPSPCPQFRVNYRKGVKGLLSSDVDYDFASLEVFQDHLNTGITGFSSFKFVAGDFFNHNKLYFMDYNHFQGNQGTTFDPTPGSFHFLPFYIYSASRGFFEAHYEHNFTGYIFNNIPGLRRLKLDEIIGVNYLTENNNHNYYEFYAGLQRLIFRVDYGVSYAGNHKYLQGFRIFYGIR